jgi:hypothetical protein
LKCKILRRAIVAGLTLVSNDVCGTSVSAHCVIWSMRLCSTFSRQVWHQMLANFSLQVICSPAYRCLCWLLQDHSWSCLRRKAEGSHVSYNPHNVMPLEPAQWLHLSTMRTQSCCYLVDDIMQSSAADGCRPEGYQENVAARLTPWCHAEDWLARCTVSVSLLLAFSSVLPFLLASLGHPPLFCFLSFSFLVVGFVSSWCFF